MTDHVGNSSIFTIYRIKPSDTDSLTIFMLFPLCVCVVCVVFEEPEDPSNRSFFSEIISSISDVKFSHTGRYIMTRDYLTVKVWDLNMENRPIETYQVFYLYPLFPGMWLKGVGIKYSVWKCGCLHNIPKCFKMIYFYMYLFITVVWSWNWPTHNLLISIILLMQ